jgi:hypothetical protein
LTLLKSIVVCLVLANVGYFLWVHGIGQAPEAPPAAAAPTLKLASESPDGARAAGADAGAAAGGLNARAAPAPSVVATPGVATSPDAGAAATGATAPGATAPGATAPAATPADPGAGLLANVKRCISVGPFRDVSEAAHAATTLRGGGYDPRQRVAEGDVWAGVWVYLPLPPSRAAGDEMLAKLKAGGIDDALEMPGPSEGSVISLGLYSEPKRAQARVAQVQALGFNPGIADRKRTGNVYWIDIDLKPTDSLLNPADLQGEAGRIVRLEVKGCPSASGAPT